MNRAEIQAGRDGSDLPQDWKPEARAAIIAALETLAEQPGRDRDWWQHYANILRADEGV